MVDFFEPIRREFSEILERQDGELNKGGSVVEFLASEDNFGVGHTARAIAGNADINYNTVRKELGRLQRENIVIKVKPKGELARYIVGKMFRHLVGMLTYCGGNKETWYARTFHFNDENDDLEQELIDQLIIEMCANCGLNAGADIDCKDHPLGKNLGYSVQKVDADKIDKGYIYPSIEVTDSL